MFVSRVLRRRVLELEQREDWHTLHTLLKVWPAGEPRPDLETAFAEVLRRAAQCEAQA